MERIQCPHCGQKADRVTVNDAGKKTLVVDCHREVVVLVNKMGLGIVVHAHRLHSSVCPRSIHEVDKKEARRLRLKKMKRKKRRAKKA